MGNYKDKLKTQMTDEQRYILEKALEYQEKLGFEKDGDGWNDATDGFRHAWGSAYLSLKYGNTKSHAATSYYEYREKGQPREEREMDEWNNSVGREIAKNIRKENKDIEKSFQWSHIEDLIAVKVFEKIKEKKVITSTTDKRLKSNNSGLKNLVDKTSGHTTGYASSIEDTAEEQESLRDRLLRSREEKLAHYTARLAESPEKIKEKESKHITLQELKAPQEAKKQKVRDIIEGKVQFDENKDYSSYQNKKNKDNKIFTQEEINTMSDEEKQKNKEAIFYQKQTIGVPTEEQAQKAVSKGGMVFVNSYTRSDGTKVRSYYRSR